ncbi:SDR family oxidoreductase [Eubacteriaceae bacterium ES2]|nr:SDR family oxidoreductase [Eubacteriaceae bacterium ES2]
MKDVTVITGGAGGMGFATASNFGLKGHSVLVCDIKEEPLKESVDILKRQNIDAHYTAFDITNPASARAAVDQAKSLGRIKNVIHTAGLSPILVKKLGSEEGSKDIMNVNAMGTINMVESFYPYLEDGASMVCFTSSAVYLMPQLPEHVLNIFSSIVDDKENIFAKLMTLASDPGRAYMFSKLFVLHYTRMNAGRFGHKGCRINSVAPGRIVTPMHQTLLDNEPERIAKELEEMPLGRYGGAYEIANLVDFLCSYKASYINGIDILMDDGTQAFNSTPQLAD